MPAGRKIWIEVSFDGAFIDRGITRHDEEWLAARGWELTFVEIQAQTWSTYEEYLKAPQWDGRRKEALKRSGFRCQVCNKGNCVLDVHHRTYERLGRERDEDLIVLCRGCHGISHDNGKLTRPE